MIRSAFRICLLGLALCVIAAGAWAQSYEDGLRAYDAGDYTKARDIWLPLAEGGDEVAQYSLGKLLEKGGGEIKRDYPLAADWYRKSAAQGIAAAQNNLGLMFAEGRGVPLDTGRAAQLWIAAGHNDHSIAQYNLALAYFRGDGVQKDKSEAELWFRRAADLGLPNAQYALGQIKRLGLTSAADEGEALNWYQMAAAQGHEKAKIQAEQLRKVGVTPKAPRPLDTAATVDAAKKMASDVPSLPPPPSEKPAEPATVEAPKAPVIPEAAETEARVAAAFPGKTSVAAAPPAQTGGMAGRGNYSIWLISMKSEAKAASYLDKAKSEHPHLLGEGKGAVVPVDFGKGRVYYRVVAGGFTERGAAEERCAHMRAKYPGTFCKVLSN